MRLNKIIQNHITIESILLVLIPLFPTIFLVEEGFYLYGDAVFPVDSESINFLSHAFYMWLENGFGSDYMWGFRTFLQNIIFRIFSFDFDFAQFIYYYVIFLVGTIGMYLFSGDYVKIKYLRILAAIFYTINIWIIDVYSASVFIQGVLLLPLMLYLYSKYIHTENLKYLSVHTLLFPFLGTLHIFWLYFLLVLIYNFIFFPRSKFSSRIKCNLLILIFSILSMSFFLIPYIYNYLTSSTDTLRASTQTFFNGSAFKFYSADQTIFNSMRLISPERFFSHIGVVTSRTDTIYRNFIILFSFVYIALTALYFFIKKKTDQKTVFISIVYIFGVFLASFHNISNNPIILKIAMYIYPPVSVDSALAIPIVMLSSSIMIACVLDKLNKNKYFIVIIIIFINISLTIFPLYNYNNFNQISYAEFKDNSLYIRSLLKNIDDSYILLYPTGAMHQFPYSKYLISYSNTFPYDKVVSYIPVQMSYSQSRNFLNGILDPRSDIFSPNLFKQIGISKIVIMKNTIDIDGAPFMGLNDRMKNSGFSISYEDENFKIFQADNYTPIIFIPTIVEYSNGSASNLDHIDIENKLVNNRNNSFEIKFLKYSINSSESKDIKIKFLKLNPTKYEIFINTTKPFILIFSENYNSQWKLYRSEKTDVEFSKNDFDYNRTELIENKREFFEINDMFRFFEKPYEEKNHFIINEFANAWYINSSGNFSMVLYFKLQSLFYIGLIISGITYILCSLFLIFELKKDYETNEG